MSDLVDELESGGATVTVLSRAEAREAWQAWCEAFCAEVRRRTGSYRYRSLHWHAFSSGLVDARHGTTALELYRAEPATSLLVIPESWHEDRPVRVSGIAHPDLSSLRRDLYVFPETLDWTMVFTHEHPNQGPFFARRA